MTLPLISALDTAPKNESKVIIRLINRKSSKRGTYNTIYKCVHEYDGMTYAQEKMNSHKQKALDILSDFPDSPAKTSLADLINYIVERKK